MKRIRKLTRGFTTAQLKGVKRKYAALAHNEKALVLSKLEEFSANQENQQLNTNSNN